MGKPKNVILIVADSLRYDAAYADGKPGVPYLEQNAVQFSNARSSGCWTLPATTCMFTGQLPHQHGATSQTRWVKNEMPTLPDILKEAGYKPLQITANPVTTDIFNVSKGFDDTIKTWDIVESKHPMVLRLAISLNRPRIRRMLMKPKDLVFEKASEDLRQGIGWAQNCSREALGKAKQLIKENNDKGQGVFMFVNLMETHYPYHMADTFSLLSKGLLNKIHEWKVLFHFLSQSFLKNDNGTLTQDDLNILRQKQRLSWKLIRETVDDFCKEMHQGQDNLVVFCADHGDNFGEQGWQYHFSNVTDGGNRVPVFWLDHENAVPKTLTHNVSSRFMQHDILRAVGIGNNNSTMMEEREDNLPMLESFWYDNEGLTMEKYKYNQAAFIDDDKRFVFRAGKWMYAPVGANGQEPTFEYVEKNFNPIQELQMPVLRKKYLEETFNEFTAFSDKVMSKIKT